MNIAHKIANELAVKSNQVEAAIILLDGGDTVPFISRYRKEVTGGLDDTQLRKLAERLIYLREFLQRRETILQAIDEQGKLSATLKSTLLQAETKTRLEDLYRPYMKKRRTKAQIAREAGLQPLALSILADSTLDPEQVAQAYIDSAKGLPSTVEVLDGAQQILIEHFSDDAELIGKLREHLWQNAQLRSTLVKGKADEAAKFSDYFDASEALKKIPSHRALALFRAHREGFLKLDIELEGDAERKANRQPSIGEGFVAKHFKLHNSGRTADQWLQECCRKAWRVKILTHIDLELKNRLRESAEQEAINVFGRNLADLLLAAPAGAKVTMGLDPGLRTGVKLAIVDLTGKLLDTATIYPHVPKNQWQASLATLAKLCAKHQVELMSIGNGTGSRETDKLVQDLIDLHPALGLTKIMVSEAGASVYSASELAANEFPELDVSIRGAVSIARRLQDPLAELVKIEPKSIGVGQYQHDVNQGQLARALTGIVEDCVNAVGVDVNSASAPLLTRVAGLSNTLANNIVQYRDENGVFKNRKQLLKVARLGAKAYEQCAGFLRIVGGSNPLDASSVHPEAYSVVKRILDNSQRDIKQLIGDSAFLSSLQASHYTNERFGEPTVRDILLELEKPGRDPRPEFKTATFKEGVENLKDLKLDMILEGVVTNVTNFGAFVDVGVHQDGLVHISALAEGFVKDPHQVVKAGDVVKVKVMVVDIARKRIGLSMRITDAAAKVAEKKATPHNDVKNSRAKKNHQSPTVAKKSAKNSSSQNSAMADAFAAFNK